MRIFILLTLGSLLIITSTNAQKRFMVGDIYSDNMININSYNDELLQTILLYKINSYMDSIGLEGYEINNKLAVAAREHATDMAKIGEASLDGKGKNATIRDRLILSDCSGIGSELVAKITIRLSNEYITYENLAEQILSRWVVGKFSKDLFSQKYFLAGISGKIDESGKKIFVSMYIGNYNSLKGTPTTNKIHGLNPYDEKVCKKLPVVADLQQGLSVNENNQIIFTHNDLKKVKKIIKESKDGLAVDIVDKSKFDDCKSIEIPADYSIVSVGPLTKPIFADKIYKNNLAEGEGNKKKITKLEVVLGQAPLDYNQDDYELNLLVIKDGCVCANIPMSYTDKKIYDFVPKINLLPDTVELQNSNKYVPKSTSTELNFKIRFEQGKYDYKPEDIKPVLDALNEPDFIINKIYIEAFSSVEGKENGNTSLQKKRAQSIVKAFAANQNSNIVDSISTATNLKDLKADAKGTLFEDVCNMNMAEATRYVNANVKDMEFLLENHRYANVKMWITYDAEGDKEQNFVVSHFNKAVTAKQLDQALAIQKYLIKKVIEGKYNEKAVSDMRIPKEKEFVGLNMNKIWATQFIFMEPIDEEYLHKIDELNKLDNTNIYVEYNDILCKISLLDLRNEALQIKLQNRIDRLYNTSVNVNLVDGLNIELQYKIMNIYKDSLGYEHQLVKNSLSKIKEIIHFDEMRWENSLKLANIFINNGDYEYAVKLLEPWIYIENVNFSLLTTYATACTKVEGKTQSNKFYHALEKIKEQDKTYFCSLFKGDKISIQTFVNIKVKDLYCKTCIK